MCNYHHTIWHELAEHRPGHHILSGQEIDLYLDLINVIMDGWDSIPVTLQESYLDVVSDMVNIIETNLYECADKITHDEMECKAQYDVLEVEYEEN